jgi:hypothetical protein
MTIRRGGFEELRGVLASAKAELAQMRRKRDGVCSGRDAAAWGAATAAKHRDKARVERDVVHAKVREARDTTRKGWNDLVTLVKRSSRRPDWGLECS